VTAETRDRQADAPGSEARVVRVDETHLESLVRFYRRVWDQEADAATVREARAREAESNPAAPGEDVPTFLFMLGDEAVGHLGTIPTRLWCGSSERPAHWLHGLWVLPEHRNGPIGFLLVREAVSQLALAMSVVVEPAPRRLFEAQGFHDFGPIPNFVRLIRPGRVLDRLDPVATGLVKLPDWVAGAVRSAQKMGGGRLAGATLAGATRLWTAGGRSTGLRVERDWPIDSALVDDLWRRMRGGLRAAASRDGPMIIDRYPTGEESPYRVVSVWSADALAGLALLRVPGPSSDPRLAGVNLAVLCEIVYPLGQPDYGLAAVSAAVDVAAELGADALLCTASHRTVPGLLRRAAFVPLPGNQHFMIRDGEGRSDYPTDLGDWWLTRGDSKADSAF